MDTALAYARYTGPLTDTTAFWLDGFGAPRRIVNALGYQTSITRDTRWPVLAAQCRRPVASWLAEVRRVEPRAFAKCVVRLERLRELGHELRRPEADTLRDGIRELRARLGHVNYRILYSIHGRVVAVLLHALVKTGRGAGGRHRSRRRAQERLCSGSRWSQISRPHFVAVGGTQSGQETV